nr:MAG TPA: hypothetical protein [Caudoviricetes sp.]
MRMTLAPASIRKPAIIPVNGLPWRMSYKKQYL